MNQSQATKKLRSALGNNFAFRVDKTAPVAERREQIRAEAKQARAAADAAAAARDARRAELLRDPVYQRLAVEAKAAAELADKARSQLHRRRITVGRDRGWCFAVEAEGDDWSEVVDKICAKTPKASA